MTQRLDPRMLSLEEKAAQLVFARLGSNMPPPISADEDAERVSELLQRCPCGGLIVFNGTASRTPAVLVELQQASHLPLLVATDMEAGLGQQFGGATVFPHVQAFSQMRTDPERAVRQAARIAAREALAAGVHVALAPVADVHRNARNPIISIRAFSDRPDVAARLASTYVRTLHEVGLLATAKHFPGHGGTSEDSHETLPVVPDSRETLQNEDFVPFRACIDAGVDVIMTAHVAYPALDPEQRPATLSAPILSELLRGSMSFDGVIMSDSMMMKGVRASASEANGALIAAGADVVLDPPDPEEAVREIVRGVHAGIISREHLDAAVSRIDCLRQTLIERHGENVFRDPAASHPGFRIGDVSHQNAAERLAFDAIRTLRTPTAFYSASGADASRVGVLAVPSRRSSRLIQPFLDQVAHLAPESRVLRLDPGSDSDEALRSLLAEVDRLVVAIFVRPAAWHAYGLSSDQEQQVLAALSARPSLLAILGSADLASGFTNADGILCTFSDMPPSQRAVVRYLFASEGAHGPDP